MKSIKNYFKSNNTLFSYQLAAKLFTGTKDIQTLKFLLFKILQKKLCWIYK